jgi:hypothetical protein
VPSIQTAKNFWIFWPPRCNDGRVLAIDRTDGVVSEADVELPEWVRPHENPIEFQPVTAAAQQNVLWNSAREKMDQAASLWATLNEVTSDTVLVCVDNVDVAAYEPTPANAVHTLWCDEVICRPHYQKQESENKRKKNERSQEKAQPNPLHANTLNT